MDVRTVEHHGFRYVWALPILLVTLVLATVLLIPVTYSQTVVKTVTVGSDPYGAAYDSGKGEVFVVNYGSDTVSVILDTNNTVVATVNVGNAPYGAAYDSGKGEVFVTNDGSNTVSVISDANDTVHATVTVGSGPIGAAYDSGKGEVFVTNEASGTVSVISDTNNTVHATVTVGNYPIGAAYDSGKGEVFVTNDGSNTVSVISDTTNTVVATVTVGSGPIGAAYDSGKGEVFVTNDGSNTVSVLSDATNTVVATVTVGHYPIGAAYDSGKGEVFAVNDGSGTVSVISDSTSTTSSSTTTPSTTSSSTTSAQTTTITVTQTIPATTVTTISSTTTITATLPATSSTTISSTTTTTTTATIPVTSGTTTITSTSYTTTTIPVTCTNPLACAATTLTVSCHYTSVAIGTADNCRATVASQGSTPTGNVNWAVSSGTGEFSNAACELGYYYTYDYYYSSCSVQFTPTPILGTFASLTANYVGDSQNSPSAGTSSGLFVTLKTTATSVSCKPKSAVADSPTVIICTVKVTGFSPTGTVTWSQSGVGSVLFSPAICTLSSGSCSVTLTGTGAGTAKLQAAYIGDANNTGSSRTTTVNLTKAPTAVVVSCTPSSLNVGSAITCTATVSGIYSSHTGTVTFTRASGKGRVTFPSKTCTLSSGSCSETAAVTTAGSFTIRATYSGDSNNLKSWGTAVSKASPTITPFLSSTAVAVGRSVTDSLTLSGGYQAGGNVAYEYFSGNTCAGTANPVGSPVTVTSGVVPESASQFFVTPGSYSWNAVYSGDSNNNGATSQCQSLAVNSAGVSISTVLSASTVFSGSSLTDSATLSGATSTAGGTVTYEFFSGGYCSGSATTVGSVGVTSGVVPSSASQVFSTPAFYSWNAVYSGDINNNGATSPCEPLNVRGIPTIATSLSAAIIDVGGSVFDTATLAGTTSTAGGTVQYGYFAGSTCTGTATLVGSPVTVTNGAVPDSASLQFGTAGSYSWSAVYSGDSNNNGASTCEPLTVNPALVAPGISASPTTVSSGGSATLTTTTPFSGGTSTYTCQWLDETPGGSYVSLGSSFSCTAGSTPSTLTGALSTTGTWYFELQVTDSSSMPVAVTSAPVAVTVD